MLMESMRMPTFRDHLKLAALPAITLPTHGAMWCTTLEKLQMTCRSKKVPAFQATPMISMYLESLLLPIISSRHVPVHYDKFYRTQNLHWTGQTHVIAVSISSFHPGYENCTQFDIVVTGE